jgi:serine/threonine protein kinase
MGNLIGQSLGRYHILEQLGEGGMAIVYKAYDTRLERDVAIKVIRRGAFPPDQLDHILKRFEREAKALAKLYHPNIVRVFDYGDHEGSPYLVMEYLPGGTLKGQLGKPIPWQEALRTLLPISEALEYAHEHKIIHRDIKPANILLTEKGQPMLTDFGIAKILEVEETAALTGSGMIVGTPEYMAPEQWTGQTTAQSDIYSLAVVLYEMVTGRKPYIADTPAAILLKQATDPLPRPKAYVPDLPDEIEKTLLKALAKTADDRYPDMTAFIVALKGSSAGEVPSPAHVQPAETLHEWKTETRTGPFVDPVVETPRSAPSSTLKRALPWAAIGLLITGAVGLIAIVGLYAWWNASSNGSPEAPTPFVESNTPDSTNTSVPTDPVQPTNTSDSATVLQPVPTTPPLVTIPYFTAVEDMFCYDGPATSYETHWELYTGQTAEVFAKWSADPNWLVLDINAPDETRTDCCWVLSSNGTLNVSLDEIKSTSTVPDRLDCSAVQ